MECRQRLPRAAQRLGDLDEAAGVRARVDLRAGGQDLRRLAVAELARGLGLDDVVDPGRAAAEVLLGRLDDVEPRATRHPLPLRVALQDSCHLRHAQKLPLSSSRSLARIPGLEVVEPAEQDLCCGSAGIYNVVQADAARELGERKAQHVLATGAQVLACANPGCLVQLATTLRRLKQPLPALHPIELVDASIRGVPAGQLRSSARR